MPQPGSLAVRLFRMREAAGLTGQQLADRMGWAKGTGRTKISKIERGTQAPGGDDIRDWAHATGHDDDIPELLALLADEQAVHRTWRSRLRGGQAPVQEDYDRRYRQARLIRNCAPLVIPALLQTAEYARAIMTPVAERWGTTDTDAAVEARMRRQALLYEPIAAGEPPRTFAYVTTEAALRLLPCPRQVMAGQLDRLLALNLENVTLGIIPFGVPLALLPTSDFLLLDDRAIVETPGGEDHVGDAESADYAEDFATLMGEAATGKEARQLITAAAGALR